MSGTTTAFVLGYSGETGKALVKLLSRDARFRKIALIGRRKVENFIPDDERIEQHIIDFDNVEQYSDAFKGCDVGFCCLGTTRAKAGTEHFVKVDRDYVFNCARVAKSTGCHHFQIVTASFSNKNSLTLYSKTKGEVEELVKTQSFQRLAIFRPGLLLGDRVESRPMEKVLKVVLTPLTSLFPSVFSVHVDKLAQAMINCVFSNSTNLVETFENKEIHELANSDTK